MNQTRYRLVAEQLETIKELVWHNFSVSSAEVPGWQGATEAVYSDVNRLVPQRRDNEEATEPAEMGPRSKPGSCARREPQGPCDTDRISEALSRISFAALPDWGAFEVPDWLVDGLRPLFARLMELSDTLKVDLLECLAHLYDSPVGPTPNLDLSEMKANLASLPTGALPFALSIIARDGSDAVPYLRSFIDHAHPDVRGEARVGLERLQQPTGAPL